MIKWSDICELLLHSGDSDTAIQHKILIERTIILRSGSRERICGTGDPEFPLQYRVKGFPGFVTEAAATIIVSNSQRQLP